MHTGMLLCFHCPMYLGMLLWFYSNVFYIHIQMLSDYTLIRFIEMIWHEDSVTCMVKT